MKNILFTILVFTIGLNILKGQDEQSSSLLKKFNVKKVETYFFNSKQTRDSLLITIEEFNKEGRRKKNAIFDSLGFKMQYDYYFLFDSIKTERRTYSGNDLLSVTKVENDIYGNEIETVDYDKNGNKTGWISKRRYNNEQKEIESKVYRGEKLIRHEKRKYHKNGNLKKIKIIKPKNLKETVRYDKSGERIHNLKSKIYLKEELFENYESLGIQMKRTVIKYKYKISIIGIEGRIDLKPNDILKTEEFYKINGLLDYEIQYLNGILIGMKKYKYTVQQL